MRKIITKRKLKTSMLLMLSILFINGIMGQSQPNIVFVISDDQGWGDLPSNWDNTEVQMPRLDALANGGTRFTNYHTVPLCAPARASLFTGQFSSENGMWRGPGGVYGTSGYKGIKRDVKMLSEYLSDAGYATGGFGKWHMGKQFGEAPNDRGFDEYRGFMGGSSPYWVKKSNSNILHNGEPDEVAGHTTELFTEWSSDFIRENAAKNKPFFCYLSYNAVHGPIRVNNSTSPSAPEEWVDRALDRGVSFLRSDYVAVLEHMDYNIGKVVDLLDELNIRDNTLIVFVSDNGGCQMDEGDGGRFPGNNGPFRGQKASTYQGGLNVPFLMNWQGQVPEGTVSDGHVMHADVFATLLDVAGIPLPEMNGKNPMRGMSLIPHMKSSATTEIPERTMIFELWGNVGVRKGKYKLWGDVGRDYSPDWLALAAKLEESDLSLFDLSTDIGEENDLRTQLPEVYNTLKNELIEHFTNVNSEYPLPDRDLEFFWDFDNDVEGWSGNSKNLSAAWNNSRYLDCTPSGNDPYIYNDTLQSFTTGNINYLEVRVKNGTSETNGSLGLFTESSGTVFIPFKMTPNASDFETILVDLSTLSKWNNNLRVNRMRIDPNSNGAAGTISFDHIYLMETADSESLSSLNPKISEVRSKMYPNPMKKGQDLRIQLANRYYTQEGQVTIYDMQGRPVLTQKRALTETIELPTHHLKEGLYMVDIRNGNANEIFKLLIF